MNGNIWFGGYRKCVVLFGLEIIVINSKKGIYTCIRVGLLSYYYIKYISPHPNTSRIEVHRTDIGHVTQFRQKRASSHQRL